MAGPLIYLGTHGIKEGRMDDALAASQDLVAFLELEHPRLLQFEVYLDGRAGEMRVIHVHPDEQSLVDHLRLAGPRIAAAYEFLEGTKQIEIFGNPSQPLVEQIQKMGVGAPVTFRVPDAGFSRLDGPSA
ncbi:MAG: hypothetical protein ACR2K4_05060 [Candidatus Limnocylindria bacterium]